MTSRPALGCLTRSFNVLASDRSLDLTQNSDGRCTTHHQSQSQHQPTIIRTNHVVVILIIWATSKSPTWNAAAGMSKRTKRKLRNASSASWRSRRAAAASVLRSTIDNEEDKHHRIPSRRTRRRMTTRRRRQARIPAGCTGCRGPGRFPARFLAGPQGQGRGH